MPNFKLPARCAQSKLTRGFSFIVLTLVVSSIAPHAFAQSGKVKSKSQTESQPPTAASAPILTRRTTRREVRRLGYGSSLALYGAPVGNITIEAHARPEIEIEAEIEMRAASESDLDQLASVINAVFDAASPNNLQVFSLGTHDKKYMKRAAKNFPKQLLANAWRIDYRIKLPVVTDLEINAGNGDITINNTEGAARINAAESNFTLNAHGGDITATIAKGAININPTARSWRGRGLDLKLGTGTLTLALPDNFNADINADILRTGGIEASYKNLAAQDETSPVASVTFTTTTDGKKVEQPSKLTSPDARTLRTRAGGGGTTFALVVGDGALRIIEKGMTEKSSTP